MRETWSQRVSTGALNRWFEEAIEKNPPPAPGGKRIKLRYITQVGTRPPTFVLFGTRTDQLPESYRRYLVNGMRKDLGFGAVPVRLTPARLAQSRSIAKPRLLASAFAQGLSARRRKAAVYQSRLLS